MCCQTLANLSSDAAARNACTTFPSVKLLIRRAPCRPAGAGCFCNGRPGVAQGEASQSCRPCRRQPSRRPVGPRERAVYRTAGTRRDLSAICPCSRVPALALPTVSYTSDRPRVYLPHTRLHVSAGQIPSSSARRRLPRDADLAHVWPTDGADGFLDRSSWGGKWPLTCGGTLLVVLARISVSQMSHRRTIRCAAPRWTR